VSRYEKKNQSGFYWKKRQWVAVASAGPYASLHLAPDSHGSTLHSFLQAGCPSCSPTNHVNGWVPVTKSISIHVTVCNTHTRQLQPAASRGNWAVVEQTVDLVRLADVEMCTGWNRPPPSACSVGIKTYRQRRRKPGYNTGKRETAKVHWRNVRGLKIISTDKLKFL